MDADGVELIRPNSVLGPVIVRFRAMGTDWREIQQSTDELQLSSRFVHDGEALCWDICVKNTGSEVCEIGDLELPLPMNTDYVWDHEETFVRRVFKHAFIAGHGSFLYWLPVKGTGRFLVMQPRRGTSLEFFTSTNMDYAHGREDYRVFVYSQAKSEQQTAGTWRQPRTGCVLQPGQDVVVRFVFQWASDYDGVRKLLYENEGFDIYVAPGMVIPRDLTARFAIRTKHSIETIVPEFAAQTEVELLSEQPAGYEGLPRKIQPSW